MVSALSKAGAAPIRDVTPVGGQRNSLVAQVRPDNESSAERAVGIVEDAAFRGFATLDYGG
jgi:hypothetical protein